MKTWTSSRAARSVTYFIVFSSTMAIAPLASHGKSNMGLPGFSMVNKVNECLSVDYVSIRENEDDYDLVIIWKEIKSLADCTCMTAAPYYWVSTGDGTDEDNKTLLDKGEMIPELMVRSNEFRKSFPVKKTQGHDQLYFALGCTPPDAR